MSVLLRGKHKALWWRRSPGNSSVPAVHIKHLLVLHELAIKEEASSSVHLGFPITHIQSIRCVQQYGFTIQLLESTNSHGYGLYSLESLRAPWPRGSAFLTWSFMVSGSIYFHHRSVFLCSLAVNLTLTARYQEVFSSTFCGLSLPYLIMLWRIPLWLLYWVTCIIAG